MTPPMTPREKVALKPCPFCGGEAAASQGGSAWFVHCETADCHEGHNDFMRSELEAAELWNRRTALASGSGDQIPGPDDVTAPSQMGFLSALGEAAWEQPPHTGSGNHAELEYYGYRAFNAGIGCCHLVANPGPNDTNPEPLVTAASAEALIAENAALRGERDEWRNTVRFNERCWSEERGVMIDRATEAERKLAEAVGLLRDLASWFDGSAYNGAWVIRSGDLGVDDAICAARTFLSKEAERG